jgi:hypothetical protein
MKKKILLVLIISLFIVPAVFSYTPFMYTFVIDSSSSVSDKDFKVANENIAAAINYLYKLSQQYPGRVANQISVAWFGGKDDYYWTPYFNGSDKASMGALLKELVYKRHPKFNRTAIYSSILKGTITSLKREEQIGYRYFKVIFLITDGSDNDSVAKHKQQVRQLFPNEECFLCVIGVGSGAKVDEYKNDANYVAKINDFGKIFGIFAEINERF